MRPTTTHTKQTLPHTPAQFLGSLLLIGLGCSLAWAILSLPSESSGLAETVSARLSESGVKNPVTAVLLNFRGYDTLLEIAVLVMAVVGVWALPPLRSVQSPRDESLRNRPLLSFLHLLAPLLIVVAGYLLWVGADAPGGAFQGGALLAAAGTLFVLTGFFRVSPSSSRQLPFLVILGFAVFLAVASGIMLLSPHFLEYPHPWGKPLILLIETALMISIACILLSLLSGCFASPPHPSSLTPAPPQEEKVA
ncbi:MAG: hydrogen gas-evolving membrane-bound hydrogenase subunit E [Candidatus Binatia bacterium]